MGPKVRDFQLLSMLGYGNKAWWLSGFLKQQEKIKYLGALEDKNGGECDRERLQP